MKYGARATAQMELLVINISTGQAIAKFSTPSPGPTVDSCNYRYPVSILQCLHFLLVPVRVLLNLPSCCFKTFQLRIL